jgi:hypothetical protein
MMRMFSAVLHHNIVSISADNACIVFGLRTYLLSHSGLTALPVLFSHVHFLPSCFSNFSSLTNIVFRTGNKRCPSISVLQLYSSGYFYQLTPWSNERLTFLLNNRDVPGSDLGPDTQTEDLRNYSQFIQANTFATTASFHVLSNSLFTHPFIRC